MSARALKEKAAAVLAKGQLERAEVLFRQALTLAPRESQTWLKHAEVLKRLGRTRDAVGSYRLAARVLDDEGHHPRAAAALKLALALLPNDVDLIADIIRSEMKTMKPGEGVRSLFPVSSPSQLLASAADTPFASSGSVVVEQLALPGTVAARAAVAQARADQWTPDDDPKPPATAGAPDARARPVSADLAADERVDVNAPAFDAVNARLGHGVGAVGVNEFPTDGVPDTGAVGPNAHSAENGAHGAAGVDEFPADGVPATGGLDARVAENGARGAGAVGVDEFPAHDGTGAAGVNALTAEDGPLDTGAVGLNPLTAADGALVVAALGDAALDTNRPAARSDDVSEFPGDALGASPPSAPEPAADATALVDAETLDADALEAQRLAASSFIADALELEVSAAESWPHVRRVSDHQLAIQTAPGARWIVIESESALSVRFVDTVDVPDDATWLE